MRKRQIRALEEADDNPEFAYFIKLPQELQIRILSLHIEDFPEILALPTTPPCARASKYLRELALPIFYGGKTFVLDYQTSAHLPVKMWLPVSDQFWLDWLSPNSVKCIRSIQLDLDFDDISVRIDLDTPLDADGCLPKTSLGERTRDQHSMRRVLGGWYNQVEKIGAKKRLKLENIHAIRRVLENWLTDRARPA